MRNFSRQQTGGMIVFLNIFVGMAGVGMMAIPIGNVAILFLLLGIVYSITCTLTKPWFWGILPASVILGGFIFKHPLPEMMMILFLVLPSVLFAAYGVRSNWSFKRTVLCAACLTGGLLFLLLCGKIFWEQGAVNADTIHAFFSQALDRITNSYRAMMLQSLQQTGEIATGQMAALDDLVEAYAILFDRALIGLMGIVFIVYSFFCTFAAKVTASIAASDPSLRDVNNYKVSKVGAALFTLAMFCQGLDGTAGIMATNFFYLLFPAMALEGIGFFSWMLAKRASEGKNYRYLYVILFGLILLFPNFLVFFVGVFALLGVFDAFTARRVVTEI